MVFLRAKLLIIFFFFPSWAFSSSVRVSSKTFTESYILAEIFSQKIELFYPKIKVERKFGIGGSLLAFESLKAGEIDLYPEYTGTLIESLLKLESPVDNSTLNQKLSEIGLVISKPLGFSNNYAIAVRRNAAEAKGITSISDLKNNPDLVAGLSYEFVKRKDGFEPLMKHYNLKMTKIVPMEHALAYQAIGNGRIDIMDVYTTDAKISELNLVFLEDDMHFFTNYQAIILARKDFAQAKPKIWQSLKELEGTLSERKKMGLNSLVDIKHLSFSKAASQYFDKPIEGNTANQSRYFSGLWTRTKEHLFLVFVSLLSSILVGVPLGIWSAKSKLLGQVILSITGVIQTLPSLALLCFFIPILGIGNPPALAALFLYALLPIVRNTYLGMTSIDPGLKETSRVLGMTNFERMKLIELPLASESILSGIKTSSVINVGTATIAAFIGAGGYGAFIVTGLAVNDMNIILKGANPSAILAIVMQYGFEILDRILIPKGLQER